MTLTAYRISTLFLCTATFALGWWGGTYSRQSAERASAERVRIDEQIHSALASAAWINKMIEIGHEQPAERDTQFRNHLISQIGNLARLEKFHTGNADDVFVMHASHSLQHLDVSSFAELQTSVRDARLVDTAKEPFLDEAHEEYAVIHEFVRRSLAYGPNSTTSS